MTNTAARNSIYTQLEADRFDAETERLHQLARAGKRGTEAQLLAMSEQYKALKAQGRDAEAAAVKAAAIAINNGAK